MGVNKVDLSTGENLFDISRDTVTPETLAEGVTAHDASGEPIVGTMVAGGDGTGNEGEKEVEIITGNIDLATLTVSNLSHTYQQICEAIEENKNVVLRCDAIIGPAFATLSYYDITSSMIVFNLLTYLNLGDGLRLYYFRVAVKSNDTIFLTPLVVSTLN